MSKPVGQRPGYEHLPETDVTRPADEPYRSYPFDVDLSQGGHIHSQVSSHAFLEALTQLPRPVHSLVREDIIGKDGNGETLRLYEPSRAVLFGPAEEYGRYSVVRDFPYYHLDSYPGHAEVSVIEEFIESNMPKSPAVYRNQQIGDIDVGVFDRKEKTVRQIEVKTNQDDIPDAKDEIDKFAAYSDTMGWDIEADIAVFYERERAPQEMTKKGFVEWYRYRPAHP